jgi:hypothetical protein
MPYAPLAGATAEGRQLGVLRFNAPSLPFNSAIISSPVNVPDFNKAAATVSIFARCDATRRRAARGMHSSCNASCASAVARLSGRVPFHSVRS